MQSIPVGKVVASVDASAAAVDIAVFRVAADGTLIALSSHRDRGLNEFVSDVPHAVEAVRTILMAAGVREPADVHAIHLGGQFAALLALRHGLSRFAQVLDPLPSAPGVGASQGDSPVPGVSAASPGRKGRIALVVGLVAVLVIAAGTAAAYFGIREFGHKDSAPPLVARAKVAVGNIPEQLVVQGNTAYVTDIDNALWVVDLTRMTVGEQIPLASYGQYIAGIAIDERTNSLIVAANAGDKAELILVDLQTHKVTGTIPLGDDFADTLGFDPELRTVYVGTGSDHHAGTGLVTANLDTRALGSLPVAKGHSNIEVDRATHKVYIADGKGVAVFDGVTKSRVATIDTGAGMISLDPIAHRLYATTSEGATDKDKYETFVKVIDLNTGAVTATIPSGMQAYEVYADPATGTAYTVSGWGKTDPSKPHSFDECYRGWLTAIDPVAEKSTDTLCIGDSSIGDIPAVIDQSTHQVYVLAGRNLVVAGR